MAEYVIPASQGVIEVIPCAGVPYRCDGFDPADWEGDVPDLSQFRFLQEGTAVITVYVSIGNSDDKLSQRQWTAFSNLVRAEVRRTSHVIHGEWYSAPDAPWQNACFCVEVGGGNIALLRELLAGVCKGYGQDSIAWAEVPHTEFITGGQDA
jgi:hypothetical protein